MGRMAKSYISERVATLKPSGIRRFFDIAATMKEVISLGIGEPDFNSPQPIIEAGMRALKEGETHYTGNRGILLDLHVDNGAVAYGIESFNARDPLAWPAFASEDDLKGLPKVKISVNECDPLRDEGRAWVARLASAGVCVELAEYAGVTHNFVVLPGEMPKGRDAVRRIAAWLRRTVTLCRRRFMPTRRPEEPGSIGEGPDRQRKGPPLGPRRATGTCRSCPAGC